MIVEVVGATDQVAKVAEADFVGAVATFASSVIGAGTNVIDHQTTVADDRQPG